MTPRQRLQATLNHVEPDRVCADCGAGFQTGMGVDAVHRLCQAVLGDRDYRVKVIEPYQMLGEIDEELRAALDLDVAGVHPAGTMFGFRTDEGWKPATTMAGTPVLVPERFNVTTEPDGSWLIYPEGDASAPPRGRMPQGGFFFDAVIEQEPIDERNLDVAANCEEFGPMPEEDVRLMADHTRYYAEQTNYGVYITLPGCAFGDVALVPAPWMRRPRGVRAVDAWYRVTLRNPDFVRAVFEKQCKFALQNVERLAAAIGDNADVAFVSGSDFGQQLGPLISPRAYRTLFKPFHTRVNRLIHERTKWKTFIHSCGSVVQFLEDFIEAGFDVLNPVQCAAADMDPRRLKREFGERVVFWGGGVDTQATLPFGTPDEVYRQVRERIAIFAPGGGFVFNAIHNVMSNVPTENLLAMFRAVKDSRRG